MFLEITLFWIAISYCVSRLILDSIVEAKTIYWRYHLKRGDRVLFKEFSVFSENEIKLHWSRTTVTRVTDSCIYIEWEDKGSPFIISRKYLYPDNEFSRKYYL